jgi:hypothetical protein
MTNWVDKQCAETVYFTPENILDAVRAYFGGPIPLDPATEPTNPTKALKFYTEQMNGLVLPWDAPVFINPPFGTAIVPFIKRMDEYAKQGLQIIALLPCGARFSTKYWQAHALVPELKAICFVKGRVKFLRPDGTVAKQNPYDSQIYGYNVDQSKFHSCFKDIGRIVFTTIP